MIGPATIHPNTCYDAIPRLRVPKRTPNSSTPPRVVKTGFVILSLGIFENIFFNSPVPSKLALAPRVVLPPIFVASGLPDDF